jgi:hypothetical protein
MFRGESSVPPVAAYFFESLTVNCDFLRGSGHERLRAANDFVVL